MEPSLQELAEMKPKQEQIWTCKIGGGIVELPSGADFPMRLAIQKAFKQITGFEAEFCFSGWSGELTEPERACVEDRWPPSPETKTAANPQPATDTDANPVETPVSMDSVKRLAFQGTKFGEYCPECGSDDPGKFKECAYVYCPIVGPKPE